MNDDKSTVIGIALELTQERDAHTNPEPCLVIYVSQGYVSLWQRECFTAEDLDNAWAEALAWVDRTAALKQIMQDWKAKNQDKFHAMDKFDDLKEEGEYS